LINGPSETLKVFYNNNYFFVKPIYTYNVKKPNHKTTKEILIPFLKILQNYLLSSLKQV